MLYEIRKLMNMLLKSGPILKSDDTDRYRLQNVNYKNTLLPKT